MNNDLKREIGIGVFFLVLAIAYIIGSTTISTFTPFGNRGLDSRSVPVLLGTLTIILSLTHIIQVYLKDKKIKELNIENPEKNEEICDPDEVACVEAPEGTIISRLEKVIPVKLILSFLFLIIYIALYQPVGFIISSTLFLIAESILLTNKDERRKWYVFIVLFSVGVSILIFFIFTKYLTLFLPRGILG
jgi:putative tricarboxylic transport membrane protein